MWAAGSLFLVGQFGPRLLLAAQFIGIRNAHHPSAQELFRQGLEDVECE
jgi:hypothetical protein